MRGVKPSMSKSTRSRRTRSATPRSTGLRVRHNWNPIAAQMPVTTSPRKSCDGITGMNANSFSEHSGKREAELGASAFRVRSNTGWCHVAHRDARITAADTARRRAREVKFTSGPASANFAKRASVAFNTILADFRAASARSEVAAPHASVGGLGARREPPPRPPQLDCCERRVVVAEAPGDGHATGTPLLPRDGDWDALLQLR